MNPSVTRPVRGAAFGLLLLCLCFTPEVLVAQTTPDAGDWQVFQMDDLRAQRAQAGRPWFQFLQVPDLFAGVYEIEAGGTDPQGPHDADEVYYVVAGAGTLVVEGERTPVGPGAVIYVAKTLDHRFVDITEDLTVLVFFATAGEGG